MLTPTGCACINDSDAAHLTGRVGSTGRTILQTGHLKCFSTNKPTTPLQIAMTPWFQIHQTSGAIAAVRLHSQHVVLYYGKTDSVTPIPDQPHCMQSEVMV